MASSAIFRCSVACNADEMITSVCCKFDPHRNEDVAALLASAPPELSLAMMLALWTGQRQGDLLRLPWSGYDGSHIRLRHSKTGRRVTIPAGEPLRLLLDRTVRRSPIILTTMRGKPWTSDGFRTS